MAARVYESPSSIYRYEKCPLSYKLRYLDGIARVEPGGPAAYGTFVHSVLRAVFDYILQTGHTGPIHDAYVRHLAQQKSTESGMTPTHAGTCANLIIAYLKRVAPIDPARVLANELDYQFDIPSAGTFRVILDRVDRISEDSIEVVDYKTGKDWNNYRTQIALYLYAAKHKYPWAVHSQFRLEFLSLGQSRYIKMTAGQLSAEISLILKNRERITAGMFDPIISMNCRWCDVRAACVYCPKKG